MQEEQATKRGAGHQAGETVGQQPGIGDGEAIHILRRGNGGDDRIRIQVLGQRELHQNAMHGGVIVEILNNGEQFRLGSLAGELVLEGGHAGLNRGSGLVADVDFGRRIVPDQNHGKARGERQRRNLRRDGGEKVCRECLTVDDLGQKSISLNFLLS